MAEVTIAAGATGSGIALSGNDAEFVVVEGRIEFSTDAGTTFMPPWPINKPIIFTDGLTVVPRNPGPGSAILRHMPF